METFEDKIAEHMSCQICDEMFICPVEFPCQHIYCSACAATWVSRSNMCPMCKADVSTSPPTRVTADKLLDHLGKLLTEENQERRRAVKRLRKEVVVKNEGCKKRRLASVAMAASLLMTAAFWIFPGSSLNTSF